MGYRKSDYYNHEGYADPTPHKAMKGIEVTTAGYVAGDIVEWEKSNGSVAQAIVLSVHSRTYTALELFTEDVEENSHKIMSRMPMFCDAGRMIVLWPNRITGLVKTMEDEAFRKLIDHVGVILGCTKEITVEKVVEKPVEVKVKEPADERTLIKLETERDLYKDLYMRCMKGEFV